MRLRLLCRAAGLWKVLETAAVVDPDRRGGLPIGGSTRAAERSTGVPAVGDSTASGPYGGLHANRRQAVTTTGSPLRLGGPSGRARKCGPAPAASCRGRLPRQWLAPRATGPLPGGHCPLRPLVRR